jgi:sulfoacetaldehyde dehydrogenase
MGLLKKEGGYLCTTEEREKVRKALWPDGKTINRDVFGRSVAIISEAAGIKPPAGTKFLMVLGEKIGPEDRFSGEKLSLVLTVWRWKDFDEMLNRLEKILEFSGIGHSVSIHTNRVDRMEELAIRAKVGRVECNMPHCLVNTGSWYNGQIWTESLGCGTWAGNMISENIIQKFPQLYWLSVPVEDSSPMRTLWSYFKSGEGLVLGHWVGDFVFVFDEKRSIMILRSFLFVQESDDR